MLCESLAAGLDLNFLTGQLDPRITFTRASNGSYFDAAGVMQYASANEERSDHDPVTLAARGLLVEERSEEHTSELQSLMRNSYAVFCLKKKIKTHSQP